MQMERTISSDILQIDMAGKRKNPAAVALAKRRAALMTREERIESARTAGLVGGKVRAAKLTPEQRKEIAKKAAAARWSKRNRKS